MEAFDERLEQFVGVVDSLGVLANNPDHGRSAIRWLKSVALMTRDTLPGFRFVECVEILAQR
jgi:hypothetical protein